MLPPARNLRSTSSSADVSSESLHADTPEWGVKLYELINNSIAKSTEDVNRRITDVINISLKAAEQKAEKAEALAEKNAHTIETLVAKLDSLQDMVLCLKDQNEKQQNHILKNETYSRSFKVMGSGAMWHPTSLVTSLSEEFL